MVNRRKNLEIEGVSLKLTLDSKDYDHAYNLKYLKQKSIIEPVDAPGWIYRNIYGQITPE